MPSYRYYTADLLTGNVLGDLPLYGTAFDRVLSRAGNFTGTYKLGRGKTLDNLNLSASIPGRTAIYVERDGTLIWGGIIWSRTYQQNSKTIQLTAQTFESYFDHVVIMQDFVKESVDQVQIFKDLINALQAQGNSNIGLDTSEIVVPATKVPTTVLVPGYEYHFASEIIDGMSAAENSFDWTVDIVPSSEIDRPRKIVKVGHPKLTNKANNLTFDFPGNIATYWWPESATASGTRFAFIGAGAGNKMFRAESIALDLLEAGYPTWWKVETDKSLGTQSQVNRQAAATRDRYKMPIVRPTFELKPDRIPPFDAWSALGTDFTAYIEDERFPEGQSIVSRMIGWSLQVSDRDNVEILKFMIEGEEIAAV